MSVLTGFACWIPRNDVRDKFSKKMQNNINSNQCEKRKVCVNDRILFKKSLILEGKALRTKVNTFVTSSGILGRLRTWTNHLEKILVMSRKKFTPLTLKITSINFEGL